MEITAKMVKELRDKTNSGMMDCKKALSECEGDLEKAIDWLRQKGLMTARKRAGRATKEGLVVAGVSPDLKKGVLLELNCETDFVAKNESFQDLARVIAEALLAGSEKPAGNDQALALACGGQTIGDRIKNLVGTIGENMNLRRFLICEAGPREILHSYIHGPGRLGVMIRLAVDNSGPGAEELAHNLAMHIAAANPMALTPADIPADAIEREKAVARAKLAESGKPENIWDKIIEGQMKKFYSEVTLLEQAYVKEPDQTIAALLKAAAKDLGSAEVKSFARFQLGEEIEGENAADDE